jgi:hypothetical protein
MSRVSGIRREEGCSPARVALMSEERLYILHHSRKKFSRHPKVRYRINLEGFPNTFFGSSLLVKNRPASTDTCIVDLEVEN